MKNKMVLKMGAWDRLDTEITITNDLDDLDSLLDLNDPYNVFEPLTEIVKEHKSNIEEGSRNAVATLANFNRSKQEQYLQKCKNPSGRLATSINDEQQTPFSFLIGTDIDEIYPFCGEYGRGPVYPHPPKKRLRFYGEGGYLIYPLMSNKAEPVPFVAPAFDDTVEIVDEILIRELGHLGVEWDY